MKISRQTSSVFLHEVKFPGSIQAYNSDLIGSKIEINIYECILHIVMVNFKCIFSFKLDDKF